MVRAIELSAKRTGSTFFQHALNTHSDIVAIDEIFVNVCRKAIYRKSGFIPYVRQENPHKSPQSYLEKYIYKTHHNKNSIFKLKYNQITNHSGLLEYIKKNNIPIINLQRRNLVKQIVSGMTAAITDHKPIKISGQQLLNLVKEAKRMNEYWANRLKDQIKLTLYYEYIIGDNVDNKTYLFYDTNVAICNFFKVKYEKMFSTTKKKNKNDLSVYLPNIEEIRKVFKNTEFEWMVN